MPEMIGPLTIKTVYAIVHVFGAVIGAGGAYMSDIIFLSSIKDKKISPTEMRFMKLGGTIVWIGLIILIISGIFLFYTNPESYMASTKFLSKVTIVAILFLNGILFHILHIPLIKKHTNEHLPSSKEFIKRRKWLFISGALSITSWTFALALGVIPSLPYTYGFIMTFYASVVAFALVSALLIQTKFIPNK